MPSNPSFTPQAQVTFGRGLLSVSEQQGLAKTAGGKDNYRDIEGKVSRTEEFKGNTMSAKWDGDLYTVKSYATPIAHYHKGKNQKWVSENHWGQTSGRHINLAKNHLPGEIVGHEHELTGPWSTARPASKTAGTYEPSTTAREKALDEGYTFEWNDDWDVGSHVKFYGEGSAYTNPDREPETCEFLLMKDPQGNVVDSLSCIDDADTDYRLYCEREMADNILGTTASKTADLYGTHPDIPGVSFSGSEETMRSLVNPMCPNCPHPTSSHVWDSESGHHCNTDFGGMHCPCKSPGGKTAGYGMEEGCTRSKNCGKPYGHKGKCGPPEHHTGNIIDDAYAQGYATGLADAETGEARYTNFADEYEGQDYIEGYDEGFNKHEREHLQGLAAVDDFTRNHLNEYAEHVCFDDERGNFVNWALGEVEADPQLAEYGWRSLLDRYRLLGYETSNPTPTEMDLQTNASKTASESWDTGEVELWFNNDEGMYHWYRGFEGNLTSRDVHDFWIEVKPNDSVDPSVVDWSEVAEYLNADYKESMQYEGRKVKTAYIDDWEETFDWFVATVGEPLWYQIRNQVCSDYLNTPGRWPEDQGFGSSDHNHLIFGALKQAKEKGLTDPAEIYQFLDDWLEVSTDRNFMQGLR